MNQMLLRLLVTVGLHTLMMCMLIDWLKSLKNQGMRPNGAADLQRL